ncbi:MAG: tripartite tricarboxylate transporter substrate binding protein [Rhodospirillaceae bacterium]|nr:tripartite tricarboxylate transporter substrate binding protein [Rhodospirillaceae bacterium]
MTLAAASALVLAGVAALPGTAAAQYPERPIELIVPWGAGGGTDATGRIIGSLLEARLGQPVNVVNRTGGSGVVGHQAIAAADPDGYTIGIATVEIGMMHWQGLTELTYEAYTPIALMNADPAAIHVAQESPYATLDELLEASEDGQLQASGTGQGGIWHLALAGMLQEVGLDPGIIQWIPSDGAASGLQDLVAGGVDLVACSMPEARSLIEAGRVRSLVIMSDQADAIFPDVPTLQSAVGSDWEMGAWRGVVGPAGMPDDVTATLVAAMEEIFNSAEFQEFMAGRGYGMVWAGPEEFRQFMADSNENLGNVMRAVGIVQ